MAPMVSSWRSSRARRRASASRSRARSSAVSSTRTIVLRFAERGFKPPPPGWSAPAYPLECAPANEAAASRKGYKKIALTPFSTALLAWYFVAVWGAGYVATKIGLQSAAPFTFLSLRFGFGLVCLLPVVLWWRPRWPRGWELAHLVVAGVLMHAVQLGGSHYAQYL